jgi:hypothetical protein
MITLEPEIIQGINPEANLHKAVVAEIHRILTQEGIKFILIEKFGLDIGVFIHNDGRDYARFVEMKAYVGSRGSGVGFGNSAGEGPQVELLLHSADELSIVESSVIWILGIGNRPKGCPHYAVFTSIKAKNAAMGMVKRGKQNNFRINDFKDGLITWAQVTDALYKFLL